MSEPADDLTPAEMSALLKALVKLVGPEKLAKLAQPQPKVVGTAPTLEDYAELDARMLKRKRRHG